MSTHLPGPKTKFYLAVKESWHLLLDGPVVSVDPSSGSASSMPAVAYFKDGELKSSEEIRLNIKDGLHTKLYQLSSHLWLNTPKGAALVYEDVAHMGKGFAQQSMTPIQRSIGAVLSAFPWTVAIPVMPGSWKKMVGPDYVKSDIEDAKAIGYAAIALAKHFQDKEKNK